MALMWAPLSGKALVETYLLTMGHFEKTEVGRRHQEQWCAAGPAGAFSCFQLLIHTQQPFHPAFDTKTLHY